MSSFYIKKLSLSGDNVKTSSIEFTNNLNIICGPSDTGKTYILECIDFIFGCDNKNFPLNKNTGYDTVNMEIATSCGDIFLKRNFEENHIYVKSNNPQIESGKYSKTKSKLYIGDLFLKLMGINSPPKIIKNQNFDRQSLTFRTFLHTFFIEEDNVSQRESILFKRKESANTAILSSLLYLITGNFFENFDQQEDKKIRQTRKNALMDYINYNLSYLSAREKEISKIETCDVELLQKKIDSILNEITQKEGEITAATIKSKDLSQEIYRLNDELAQCSILASRYENLRSQYMSDIKRLTFIVEGQVNGYDFRAETSCPICYGSLPKIKEPSFIEASNVEVNKLLLKIKDLDNAENDLICELNNLQEKNLKLTKKRREIESLINSKLKPQINKLKETLDEYKLSIENHKESSIIKSFQDNMISDLQKLEVKYTCDMKYKPKEYFKKDFLNTINKKLQNILKCCFFENSNSVKFDLSSFDIMVSGKSKLTYGKGYRAFLNTIMALALREYLLEHGKFCPRLLILDSPILSLIEKGEGKASDSMKGALFKYLINHKNDGQTIIVENSIPEVNYDDVNVIRFTKDEKSGRYGFLQNIE